MNCRGIGMYHFVMSEKVSVDQSGDWLQTRLNISNFRIARLYWQNVDHNYNPIDWQLDLNQDIAGLKKWNKRLTYGHKLGVDVKVPWELSRMQHIPQMVLYAAALWVRREENQTK